MKSLIPILTFLFVWFNSNGQMIGEYAMGFDAWPGGDEAIALFPTQDSGYLVFSNIVPGFVSVAVSVCKLDKDLNPQWQHYFPEIPSIKTVTTTSDGHFLITGWRTPASNRHMCVAKVDSLGEVKWCKSFNAGGLIFADGFEAIEAQNHAVYSTGYSKSQANDYYGFVLFKQSLATGATDWGKVFVAEPATNSQSHAIAQGANGNILMAGHLNATSAVGTDAYVIMTDKQGVKLWSKAYDLRLYDLFNSIAPTSDGGFVLAGVTYDLVNSISEEDIFLMKIDSLGNTVWAKTFAHPNVGYHDLCYYVMQDGDGFLLSGWYQIGLSSEKQLYLLKTDANGNLLMASDYGRALDDYGGRHAIQTPNNGYAVVGSSKSIIETETRSYIVLTDDSLNTCSTSKAYPVQDSNVFPASYTVQESIYTLSNMTNVNITEIEYAIRDTLVCLDEIVADTTTIGTIDLLAEKPLKVFPNPCINELSIAGLEQRSTYQVMNSMGQFVLQGNVRPQGRIGVASLPQGVYFIYINEKQPLKFIKH